MPKISKPLSAEQVIQYHKEQYASKTERNYYTRGNAVVGEWHGQLALHDWGFEPGSAVQEEHIKLLAYGRDPLTGEQLVNRKEAFLAANGKVIKSRSAWDMTLAPHKSFTAAALVGGDERLVAAHDRQVRIAADWAEKYIQARIGGNFPAVTTGRWAAAIFRHDTSRPVIGHAPDPQLHSHVVFFNLTKILGEDRFRALQPKEMFQIQTFVESIYQAGMAYEGRHLGYDIEQGVNHSNAIKGFSPEYLQAISKRTQQIEQLKAEKGMSGAEADEHINRMTRQAKQKWEPEALRAVHLEEAAGHGNDPLRVVQDSREQHSRHLGAQQRQSLAEEALTHARKRLEEQEAVFDQYQVLRDALQYGLGRLSIDDVWETLQKRLRQDKVEFIRVGHVRSQAPGERYTTPDHVHRETALLHYALNGMGQAPAIAHGLTKADFREEYKANLTDGQKHLVWDYINSTDKVTLIQAGPGRGKTHAIKALNRILQNHGYQTIGVAATSSAVGELDGAGFSRTQTIQSFELRPQLDPQKIYVLLVDEASLVSTSQMYQTVKILEARNNPADRILISGDIRQHQAVDAGRPFHELQMAGVPTLSLKKLLRQQTPELKQIVSHVGRGELKEGLQIMDRIGAIREIPNRLDRHNAVAVEFLQNPYQSRILSADNESRQQITGVVRAELQKAQYVEENLFATNVLMQREVQGQDRRRAQHYQIGDVIQYMKGNKAVGVRHGEYVRVVSVDADNNVLGVITTKSPQTVYYDPERAYAVQVFEEAKRDFAVGDRIQFTQPGKVRGVKVANRDGAVIEKLDATGRATVKLDRNQKLLTFDMGTSPHIDYGYAWTSYSSQSATVYKTIVNIDTSDSTKRALVDQALANVAFSRPTHELVVFTDSKQDLCPALSRESQKPMALSEEQIRQMSQRPAVRMTA